MSVKARVLLLSLVALLLVGSAAPGAAYAEAGPFFLGRKAGTEGSGVKIEGSSPAEFQGEGGEQRLNAKVSGSEIEVVSKGIQEKGILYNNALQGQIKAQLGYLGPRLVKPELKGCEVKIGPNNEIKAEGHLAWKWNGENKQLEEPPTSQKPGLIYTATPIVEGEKELAKGTFAEITLTGEGCSVLKGKFAIKGNESENIKPANPGEWSSELSSTSPGWKQQHYWDGKEFAGVTPSLAIGEGSASVTGEKVVKKVKKEKETTEVTTS